MRAFQTICGTLTLLCVRFHVHVPTLIGRMRRMYRNHLNTTNMQFALYLEKEITTESYRCV